MSTIGFTGADFGWTYSVGPIAGIIAPFLVGMVVDRFFPSQLVLGAFHLLGGVIMIGATLLMRIDVDLVVPLPWLVNVAFFGYMLTYYPTLALTNSLAMHNMSDPEKEFPFIRVLGTIGWIVAGWVLALLSWGDSINMFYLTGGAALVLGVYSFTLPHTPPPAKGKKVSIGELVGRDAWVLFRRPRSSCSSSARS